MLPTLTIPKSNSGSISKPVVYARKPDNTLMYVAVGAIALAAIAAVASISRR